MDSTQEKDEALSWALDDVQAQLLAYPHHRFRREDLGSWHLDAPNGLTIYVEATSSVTDVATVVLTGSTTGKAIRVGRRELNRTFIMPIDETKAALPDVFYLVFEDGGHVAVFDELGDTTDVYVSRELNLVKGAYGTDGEVLDVSAGALFLSFVRSGRHDPDALRMVLEATRETRQFADDPHMFAVRRWLQN